MQEILAKLKTLVVEYDDFDQSGMRVFAKQSMVPLKQLPLKYSQWQLAIDNGEVDSDKVVEFEPSVTTLDKWGFSYAKIIPQKKDWSVAKEDMLACIVKDYIHNDDGDEDPVDDAKETINAIIKMPRYISDGQPEHSL